MNDSELVKILTSVKTVALVGASDKPERASYYVMEYLLSQNYQVTPVNPKLAGKTLLGQKVYAELSDIPYFIDMVDVFRNADAVFPIAEEAVKIGANVLWLQLGIVNEEAVEFARKQGMSVVMDRCPKIEIPRLGLEKSH